MSNPTPGLASGGEVESFDLFERQCTQLRRLQWQQREVLEECIIPGIGSILAHVVSAASSIPATRNLQVAVYRMRQEISDDSLEEVGVRLSNPEDPTIYTDVPVYSSVGASKEVHRPFQPSDAKVLGGMVAELEFFAQIDDVPLSSDLTHVAAQV